MKVRSRFLSMLPEDSGAAHLKKVMRDFDKAMRKLHKPTKPGKEKPHEVTEGETGTHGGLKVYGPRPNEAAMQHRLGQDFSQARKALELVKGFGRKGEYRYYVEVWAIPMGGAFTTYHMRRDGRIGIGHSGYPISAENVVLL